MYVNEVNLTKHEALYRCPDCGGRAYAEVRVEVRDEYGMPVPNAIVIGRWNDDAAKTVSFATDLHGVSKIYSPPVRFTSGEEVSFSFCVTDLAKPDWEYIPEANTVTCAVTEGQDAAQ